jgi:hypothetical protein|tara:strand:- start:5379 stop:6722 length:1344 start_codon:yes stop_codon:yes gene_type:complete
LRTVLYRSAWRAALLLLLHSTAALADDFFADIPTEGKSSAVTERPRLSVTGELSQDLAYGLAAPLPPASHRDQAGVDSLSQRLRLQLTAKPNDWLSARLSGTTSFEWASWDNGELDFSNTDTDLELKDAYADAALGNKVWLRAGNQIIAWGEAKGLAITDVINPRDSTKPGQAELEDIRVQVPALYASFPTEDFFTELAFTWDAGGIKTAARGEAFDPFITVPRTSAQFVDVPPEKHWELIGRVSVNFNGGDLSIVAGDLNWDEISAVKLIPDSPSRIELGQARGQVLGFSGNRAQGNWLLRFDVAQQWNKPLRSADVTQIPWDTRDQTLYAIAAEYSGISDWLISLELDAIQTHQHTPELAVEHWQLGYFARARWAALNERLRTQFVVNGLPGDDGRITRLSLQYQWSDALHLNTDLVLYHAREPEALLYNYRNQDLIRLSVSYFF